MDKWVIKYASASAASVSIPAKHVSDVESDESRTSFVVDETENGDSTHTLPASPIESRKKQINRDRPFRDEWKKQYSWLVQENSKQGKKCLLCNLPISGSRTHLERHESSEAHKKALYAASKSLKINDFVQSDPEITKISDAAKKLEVRLCLFIAEHNLPFAVVDHLIACLKADITDSPIIKKVKLNRFKSQKIIKELTGPENITSISRITSQQYFSLIIDESTDSAMAKNLAIIIRVFDNQCRDRFLKLAPLNDCSAQGIFDTVVNTLEENNVSLKNLIAFTADNCSVMMGKHNGVQAKLKEIIPKLLVNGCICHNLNLISMAASAKLPDVIDRLIREINHHFCNSPSRKADFEKFQTDFGTELHVILKYSNTRWLSRQAAIDRIIEQWTALSYYFAIKDFENQYGNENISFIEENLNNKTMKMYFIFLSYILKIINGINTEMQAEEPKMHIFLPRMKFLFRTIARNYIKKTVLDASTVISDINFNLNENQVSIENIYCGSNIELYVQTENISHSEILDFKCNVKNFYISFCEGLVKRIDFGNEALTHFTKFAPDHVLSGETNSILPLIIKVFPETELINAERINEEYRSLADLDELKMYKHYSIKSPQEYYPFLIRQPM